MYPAFGRLCGNRFGAQTTKDRVANMNSRRRKEPGLEFRFIGQGCLGGTAISSASLYDRQRRAAAFLSPHFENARLYRTGQKQSNNGNDHDSEPSRQKTRREGKERYRCRRPLMSHLIPKIQSQSMFTVDQTKRGPAGPL